MPVDSRALADELRFLRKERSTRHAHLLKRLGPCVKQLCGIVDEDTVTAARNKIGIAVKALLKDQPKDLQIAAMAALALHLEADHKLLRDRTIWLAHQLVCDERTARRRIDEAFARLVAVAEQREVSEPEDPARERDGWYVKSFRVLLRLDTPAPEAVEHRIIGFTQDGIEKIVYRFSLPRIPGDISSEHEIKTEELYGVRLRRCERPIPEHFRFHLELPKAFRAGEHHEYGLLLRLPQGQPMSPYYVYTPYRHCDLFDLTVRFDPKALPQAVWRLSDAVLPMIESGKPNADLLTVNKFGEVSVIFRRPQRGLGYGLRWMPASEYPIR